VKIIIKRVLLNMRTLNTGAFLFVDTDGELSVRIRTDVSGIGEFDEVVKIPKDDAEQLLEWLTKNKK